MLAEGRGSWQGRGGWGLHLSVRPHGACRTSPASPAPSGPIPRARERGRVPRGRRRRRKMHRAHGRWPQWEVLELGFWAHLGPGPLEQEREPGLGQPGKSCINPRTSCTCPRPHSEIRLLTPDPTSHLMLTATETPLPALNNKLLFGEPGSPGSHLGRHKPHPQEKKAACGRWR